MSAISDHHPNDIDVAPINISGNSAYQSSSHIKVSPNDLEGYFISMETGKALED